MKKFFTFLCAALMSVSMFGVTVTQDITMDPADWGWGYNCQVVNEGDLLKATLTGGWGAIVTRWEPTIDLSDWDKIVIVVDYMSDCEGQWWKLKAYLRDLAHMDSENGQMEGMLDVETPDDAQNFLIIDLKQQGSSVDLTSVGVLGIQCEPNGAVFKISRVFLEKKEKPETAPAAPTHDEADVLALYCNHYTNNNLYFEAQNWNTTWQTLTIDGTAIVYTPSMSWDAMTNWGSNHYDVSAYEKLHADIWVPADARIKLTFEALGINDGGSGWKNGASFDLVANQWNSLDIDLLDAPYSSYDFTDVRYLILEELVQPDGSSADGTPLAIANVYFWGKAEEVVREKTKLGVNFPTENRPADNSIEMAGTFREGTMWMERIDIGWFLSYDFVHAAENETFKFRDTANPNMVLCTYNAASDSWVQAIFKFGDWWTDDMWRGEYCKLIEIDLNDASRYAWMEGMPEPEPADEMGNLYLLGNNQNWDPTAGIELTKNEQGLYEGTFVFTDETSWLTFVTVLDANWNVVNANRFGGETTDPFLSDGSVVNLVKFNGDNNCCFTIAPGTYHFVVDMNNMTLSVTLQNDITAPSVSVTDNSIAEWDNLPADYVAIAVRPDDAALPGLKGVAVFADKDYINILIEPDMEELPDLEWVPFNVFIDADNSDATGGYGDMFADANADIMLEGAVFAEGQPYSYNPAVYKWWGEVGGNGWEWTDPSVAHDGSDYWGAIIGEGQLPVGASQFVDGKIEIQLSRALLATAHPMNDTEFGIGFSIMQNWSSVGVLPCVSPTDDNPNGFTFKLKVPIYQSSTPEPVTENKCGDNLTWSFADSVLTISGTGDMWYYSYYDYWDDYNKYYHYFSNAPWYCLPIKSVVIEEGVTSISAYVFCQNQFLTMVELPSTLSYIGDGAFRACTALTTIYAHGSSPASIEWSTFEGINKSSVSVYVPLGSGNAYRRASYWYEFNIIEPESGSGQCGDNLFITIADNVLTITGTGDMWDYDYNYPAPWSGHIITSATMEEGATSIGRNAFSSCNRITEFIIPSTVTRIGANAFDGCHSLTSIIVPDGVTSIGQSAFAYCNSLTHLYIPASVEEMGQYNLIWNQELTHLTAPASIFSGYDGYYSVDYYFSEYTPYLTHKLDTLIINRGEMDAYTYGTIALSNKTMLHMDLGGTENTELQDEAFANFYNLRSVVLPAELEAINYKALAGCIELESITIPASVTEIGKRAFEDCRSLLSINFEAGSMLTKISDWAFYNCHELQSIDIPEGVTEIGKAAFFDCVYLNNVIVPASVQAIGDNAFALCSRMQQMRVKAVVPPSIASKTFEQVSRQMPVYVPMNSVDAYKADPLWGQMNIIGADEQWSGVDNVTSTTLPTKQLIDGQLYLHHGDRIYDAQGRQVR